jgi:hypothetical protein
MGISHLLCQICKMPEMANKAANTAEGPCAMSARNLLTSAGRVNSVIDMIVCGGLEGTHC